MKKVDKVYYHLNLDFTSIFVHFFTYPLLNATYFNKTFYMKLFLNLKKLN